MLLVPGDMFGLKKGIRFGFGFDIEHTHEGARARRRDPGRRRDAFLGNAPRREVKEGASPPMPSFRPMVRLRRALAALPSGIVLTCSVVLVVGVGWADHATGIYLSFALFYLVPVGLVAWRLGRGLGPRWPSSRPWLRFAGNLFHRIGGDGLIPIGTASRDSACF